MGRRLAVWAGLRCLVDHSLGGAILQPLLPLVALAGGPLVCIPVVEAVSAPKPNTRIQKKIKKNRKACPSFFFHQVSRNAVRGTGYETYANEHFSQVMAAVSGSPIWLWSHFGHCRAFTFSLFSLNRPYLICKQKGKEAPSIRREVYFRCACSRACSEKDTLVSSLTRASKSLMSIICVHSPESAELEPLRRKKMIKKMMK